MWGNQSLHLSSVQHCFYRYHVCIYLQHLPWSVYVKHIILEPQISLARPSCGRCHLKISQVLLETHDSSWHRSWMELIVVSWQYRYCLYHSYFKTLRNIDPPGCRAWLSHPQRRQPAATAADLLVQGPCLRATTTPIRRTTYCDNMRQLRVAECLFSMLTLRPVESWNLATPVLGPRTTMLLESGMRCLLSPHHYF